MATSTPEHADTVKTTERIGNACQSADPFAMSPPPIFGMKKASTTMKMKKKYSLIPEVPDN